MHRNFGKVIYYQSCMSGFESDDDLLASHDQSFQNNIGINHGFECINIRRVPRKVFEHEAECSNTFRGTRRMLIHSKPWLIAILA